MKGEFLSLETSEKLACLEAGKKYINKKIKELQELSELPRKDKGFKLEVETKILQYKTILEVLNGNRDEKGFSIKIL